MKIGEFAQKHKVTIDTVRHYIAEGLLTPLKANKQYDFSENDESVLETILLLKSMNFKLEEMKPYLIFQTLFLQNTFSCLGNFEEQFREKMEENEQEIQRLALMNRRIEKLLDTKKEVTFRRGIPLGLVDELFCPSCGVNLELAEPLIEHNEIMSGRLCCHECGREYHIRYGVLSDQIIEDIDSLDDVREFMQNYVQVNDEKYLASIRELYAETYNIVSDNSMGKKNVLIDCGIAQCLDGSILRGIDRNSTLVILCQDNWDIKTFHESIFPRNTICYFGDKSKIPFKMKMDYLFLQNYDVKSNQEKTVPYWRLSEDARVDCFKILAKQGNSIVSSEETFLKEMRSSGFEMMNVHKSEEVICKKDSPDLEYIGKVDDMILQYAIYSFKTLG